MLDVTYWQVIDASSLQARPDNGRLFLQAAKVQRGVIKDRNGTLLAGRTVGPNGYVKRYYTDPSLSQVLGYDTPRFGKSELEKSYDSYLTGQAVGSNWRQVLDQLEHRTVVGDDLTLTIDDNLQKQVAGILPERPAAAIVANPSNGEILAMVSKPTFDSGQVNDPAYWNSLLNNSDRPLINRATNGYYPPGSTFKVVTLSAALDAGLMSLTTPFNGFNATGPLKVDYHTFPSTISNLQPWGVSSVDLEHALMYSDNIVFAQVGLALGASRFLDYTKRFGVDQPVPFDIPVSQGHVQTPGEVFDRVQLAITAFGQGGLNLTPLHMLMATEAIANGGSIPKPVLVKQVTGPDGGSVKSGDYGTLSQPISATAAGEARDAMVQVVEAGSGDTARIPGLQIAAKTGTAETKGGLAPHSWFICFAPADKPRIAIALMVEHGGEGRNLAAPLSRQILLAAQRDGLL